MSENNSPITIQCEPIEVSGEIEIEKVNKLSLNPFMNKKVSKKKSSAKQKSKLVGFIFITIAIPLLLLTTNRLNHIMITGKSYIDVLLITYGGFGISSLIIGILGLTNVFAR